jgi:hypothetical protein
LARANYPYEKRQRDLRKKKKREEKRLRKQIKRGIDPTAEGEAPAAGTPEAAPPAAESPAAEAPKTESPPDAAAGTTG